MQADCKESRCNYVVKVLRNSGNTSFSEVPKYVPSSTELHLSDSDDASDGMSSMSYFQEEADSDSVDDDLHVTEIWAHLEYSYLLLFPN